MNWKVPASLQFWESGRSLSAQHWQGIIYNWSTLSPNQPCFGFSHCLSSERMDIGPHSLIKQKGRSALSISYKILYPELPLLSRLPSHHLSTQCPPHYHIQILIELFHAELSAFIHIIPLGGSCLPHLFYTGNYEVAWVEDLAPRLTLSISWCYHFSFPILGPKWNQLFFYLCSKGTMTIS